MWLATIDPAIGRHSISARPKFCVTRAFMAAPLSVCGSERGNVLESIFILWSYRISMSSCIYSLRALPRYSLRRILPPWSRFMNLLISQVMNRVFGDIGLHGILLYPFRACTVVAIAWSVSCTRHQYPGLVSTSGWKILLSKVPWFASCSSGLATFSGMALRGTLAASIAGGRG